ncbi:efflux RND transporter periplasmic adaptor subunit [Candidatus Magnetaquicoccus inordinatus]|uniref:efflux RND transporter periplasmic adaptor subunit n=1 Tax=Candidatus Magnetaquicoccus inordinatus TaxID=2496818 RepID=UPI00102C74C3|nr:efflux RND transporter periplasmic adaptor subunit [Candidatus Magnetaquicoccus inordinatus]
MDRPLQQRRCTQRVVFMALAGIMLFGSTVSARAAENGDATIHLRGVVLPVSQSKLGFTQSGVVVSIPLEGAEVKKGMLLARIDDAVVLQQLAKADAALANAQLKLQQAVHAQEKNKRLYAENVLADMALKEGEFAIIQGRIGVDQGKAEREAARLAVEGTKMLAPFDGVVAKVTAHLGEWIGAGAPVLELVDMSQLEVSMDVPPDSLSGLQVGMETAVLLEGQRVGTAKARTILPLVDAASGLRRVMWRIIPNPGQLMTGRYVTLERWKVSQPGGKP